MSVTDPIPTLTLLAKLYRDQALAAWTAGDDETAKFYDGAASGVRVALQILVPMISENPNSQGSGKAGRSKQPSRTDPPLEEATPDPPPAVIPPVKIDRYGTYPCPECGVKYERSQHVGLHRKKEHGIPSLRDRGLNHNPKKRKATRR